ncbi:MAG: hypothetical protein K8M05_06895 [Deltaproteobacteria bacterium]|nr:hypothetical protein [Kofleriaceae bacterium]
MRIPTVRVCLLAALATAACDDTVGGNVPVGGEEASDAALERFVRRAYIDLSGLPPSDADLAAEAAALRTGGNTPAARRALVQKLMGQASWANVWVEELENRVFGGDTLEVRYQFLCSIIRQQQEACRSCTAADPCDCSCQQLSTLKTERDQLATSASDLRGGTSTSAIERRYAMAIGYFALSGEPENRARALFDDFLGRPAEGEEIENARAMIFGGLGGGPAGLLFQRHGSNYADLIDIVFDDEIYREAVVAAVFERYLARQPSSAERSHFVSVLDANDPDAQVVIEAVLSSKEYFDP